VKAVSSRASEPPEDALAIKEKRGSYVRKAVRNFELKGEGDAEVPEVDEEELEELEKNE